MNNRKAKKIAKAIMIGIEFIFFPILLAMALGYWVEDKNDISYWEAIKRVW